jgi:hypothetical protein
VCIGTREYAWEPGCNAGAGCSSSRHEDENPAFKGRFRGSGAGGCKCQREQCSSRQNLWGICSSSSSSSGNSSRRCSGFNGCATGLHDGATAHLRAEQVIPSLSQHTFMLFLHSMTSTAMRALDFPCPPLAFPPPTPPLPSSATALHQPAERTGAFPPRTKAETCNNLVSPFLSATIVQALESILISGGAAKAAEGVK